MTEEYLKSKHRIYYIYGDIIYFRGTVYELLHMGKEGLDHCAFNALIVAGV